MIIKNSNVFTSSQILTKLASMELPVLVSYKLAKNIKSLGETHSVIDEQRTKLIKEFGKDGKIEATDTEALNKFYTEFNKILELEEEVDINPIKLEDLASVSLSPQELMSIEFMIEGDD